LDKLNKDSEVYKILSQRFLGLESENQQVNFRTIIETDFGFSIDTDDFIYIEDNEHHSYTFQIVKDSLANLENLVLNYNLESENYDAYLIEYLIDEEDEENIINHEEINDFISKTRISYLPEFNSNSLLQQRSFFAYISTCTYTVTYEQEIIFTGYQYGGGGVYETISTPIYTLVSCTYDFVGDGGSSGAPVYQIEDGRGSNNGGGGGPQNPNNPSVGDNNSGNTNNGGVGFGDGNGNIVTTPVKNLTITTASSLFFNALNSSGNNDLKMWWNVPDNYVASNFIMAYLNANNTIPQNMQNASTFAINLINYCVINQFYGSEAQSFFISQVLQQSLTSSQQSWWNNPNNTEAVAQIIGYLGQNGLNPIYNNNTPRTFNTQSWDFAKNLTQLYVELENNPSFLIDIPNNQYQNWLPLVQYSMPLSVINKISNLQAQNSTAVPTWDIQHLDGAQGAIVNMDFFPVTITQFPFKPNSTQRYTAQEFYNYFRLNINQFTAGTNATFYPSTITGVDENAIWTSNNPLNAIISINMQPDSGSVICSKYTSNHWYFTTLTTPWAFSFTQDDYDGLHPVSGNRAFGYYQDTNGNYVFYVRGID